MGKGERNREKANEARLKSRQIIENQQKKDKLEKKLKIFVPIVLVIALVVGAFFLFSNASEQKAERKAAQQEMINTKGEQKVPTRIDANGAYHITANGVASDNKEATGETRLDMFFDPQCPACGMIDRGTNKQINTMVDNNELDLFIYPVSFLDQTSTDNYSSRATNAVVTIAENSPENTMKFINKIFEEDVQPSEGSQYSSVTDNELAEIAVSVGVPEDIAKKITEKTYIDWVISNSEKQIDRQDYFSQGFSTPAVFLNTEYKNGKAEGFSRITFKGSNISEIFEQAIAEAKSN